MILGLVGRIPLAGVAWQALHYLEGFRRLGCDVRYVEDTGDWTYDPEQNTFTDKPEYPVRFLGRVMEWAGLGGRWAYRSPAPSRRVFGCAESELSQWFATADALVNVTGATYLRDEHLRVPVRIYLETDPVQPQIGVARGETGMIERLERHTHHFTFGENLGAPDCPVPVGRFAYRATRQPVVLDWWPPGPPPGRAPYRFTTVATWRNRGKDADWAGQSLAWSKHAQFAIVAGMPGEVTARLELALAGADAGTVADLEARGWRITDALATSRDLLTYRTYISGSDAEFTVAKEQYVASRSGWFSDRSACYLAAGKPVVTQDTGFAKYIPAGAGLFAFATVADAIAAVETISVEYDAQSRAAREIAAEYFDSDKVLRPLLETTGL